jgi:hypothetical protein
MNPQAYRKKKKRPPIGHGVVGDFVPEVRSFPDSTKDPVSTPELAGIEKLDEPETGSVERAGS